jgi:5-formaminoimidazole-4-carboxamide-1-beta-D-ribofuranosyl 5'-monophosphate synthetase
MNSFNTENYKIISVKIEVVKSHSDKEILRTFKKIINDTLIVNEGVNPKTRNKVFKPLYVEINTAISGKAYNENTQSALTKEIKRFFSIE